MLAITSLAAALLAILYVALGLRVIILRRTGIGPSVGMGTDERFVRAVRAHANLGEYIPLFLILLLVLELQAFSTLVLSVCAAFFVIGRVLHAIGFGFLGTGPWRTLGMVLTNTVLVFLAGVLLYTHL